MSDTSGTKRRTQAAVRLRVRAFVHKIFDHQSPTHARRNAGRRLPGQRQPGEYWQLAGAEVVQVYLGLPPGIGEPPMRLVGWSKVLLSPAHSKR